MKLDSKENLKLIRNCVIVEIQQLHTITNFYHTDDIDNTLDEYEKILECFKNKKTTEALNLLQKSNNNKCQKFYEYMCNNSNDIISKKYLDIMKNVLDENNLSSEYERFQSAFLQKDEQTKNFNELEEEPENEDFSSHSTNEINNSLNNLNKLLEKKSLNNLSQSEFKNISKHFKDLSIDLGISKFQQYFNNENKKIIDIHISNSSTENSTSIFKTDFNLIDNNNIISQVSLQEPARDSIQIMNDYQTLCYSYLEADKFSKMDESQLTPELISSQMKIFKECYLKLNNMSKRKISIAGNRAIFSEESNLDPTKLDLNLSETENEHEL